ncbi:MAG: glycine zipper family protein [Gammaproteobacteria bacterium]|jgi:outer membrane lipoprotein SlyB|nr:glycine zipper family protein [Gammaproteobacteria bacterium]MBT5204178.1 glycine zipper family protein [Gammaproteobacteria bacterium]MBT5602820.1 glycine zipper family protein [Gammaproteobacteria bacterium]MBT6246443.1 glycine zipper family protein [Gammaproteobacteria bacterium]
MIKSILAFTIVLLTACASDPIIDQKGVDPEQYAIDLRECEQYVAQVNTTKEAVSRGLVSSVFGGLLGAVVGDQRDSKRYAGGAAVVGTGRGLENAERRKRKVLIDCMKSRGYRIFG